MHVAQCRATQEMRGLSRTSAGGTLPAASIERIHSGDVAETASTEEAETDGPSQDSIDR